MIVVGIDPGANTGFAQYIDGKLCWMSTILPWNFHAEEEYGWLVVIEDSTLISRVFTAPKSTSAASMKIARNVGEIDAWCKMIKAKCAENGVAYLSVSPKQKGSKLNAEQFEKITGWVGRQNQHERDAAMVAWPYRNHARIKTQFGLNK